MRSMAGGLTTSHVAGRWAPVMGALLAVIACGCMQQTVEITGGGREEILAFAGPIAENIMAGYNEANYTKYSRDFSGDMRRGLPADSFDEQRNDVHEKIGLYLSKANPRVYERGIYVWAEYDAEFEEESGVMIRAVFDRDDPNHMVEGLWFDSPKLRS